MIAEVVKVKTEESGNVREYIDFLLWRGNLLEESVFAAPFIKGDPVAENLTIEQDYSSEQLKKLVPADCVFHHVVLNYFHCTTPEKAYLWAKQFLRDTDIRTLCIIVIHSTNVGYHAHILISYKYPLEQLLEDMHFNRTGEMLRRWQEAAAKIPNGADPEIKGNLQQVMVLDESRYLPYVQLTL